MAAEPARKINPAPQRNSGDSDIKGVAQLVKESQGNAGKPGAASGPAKKPARVLQFKSRDELAVKAVDSVSAADDKNDLNPDREPEDDAEQKPETGQPEQAQNQEDPNKRVQPEAEGKNKDAKKNKPQEDAQGQQDAAKPGQSQPGSEDEDDLEQPVAGPRSFYQGPPGGVKEENSPQSLAAKNIPNKNQKKPNENPEDEANSEEQDDNQDSNTNPSQNPQGSVTQQAAQQGVNAVEGAAGRAFINWMWGFSIIGVGLIGLDLYILAGMFVKNPTLHQLKKTEIVILGIVNFILLILLIMLIWGALNYVCTGFTGLLVRTVGRFNSNYSFCSQLKDAGLLIHF